MKKITFNELLFYAKHLKNNPNINKYKEILELLKELPNIKPAFKTYSDAKHTFIELSYRYKILDIFLYFRLIQKYDAKLSENLYSFRPRKGIHKAVQFAYNLYLSKRFFAKLDIKNYFPSIDREYLINKISDFEYLDLIKSLISLSDQGIPLGLTISGFLSNLYISELDFQVNDYIRYADDILIFSQTEEELNDKITLINKFLLERNLSINHEKFQSGKTDQPLDFLGYVMTRVSVLPREGITKNFYNKIEKINNPKINSYKPWFFFEELFLY